LKYIIRAVIVLIVLVSIWIAYNTLWIWRDYLTAPPVNFIENADISLGLYPEGSRSASVFTSFLSSPDIPAEAIKTLRLRLMNLGVKGTFFISPFQPEGGELTENHLYFWELVDLQDLGFEIAQAGARRNCNPGEREEDIVVRGRDILTGLGLRIRGYRSSLTPSNGNIGKILDREGYIYDCLSSDPPITIRTLLFPVFRGSVIFPFHPQEMRLLEFVSRGEPVTRPKKARETFAKIHRRGGVFIFRTELPRVREERNLALLEDFLRYIKEEDTWICTLIELCDWWLAREKVVIATSREGNILNIIYDNQTPIEMRNARINFKNTSSRPKMYRVMDRAGEVAAEGFIPETGWINVTLFPYNRE
jgi:hypothetical protein